MKKSELWLLREGISRDLNKIYGKVDEFVDAWEKRYLRQEMKILRLEDKLRKRKK